MYASSISGGSCQKYSAGVLIGNWFEEMCVERDRLRLYQARQRMPTPQSQSMLKHLQTQTFLPKISSGPVQFGKPLLLVNLKTKCALALDLSPLIAKGLDKAPVTGLQSQIPQLRSTWVIERCPDDNNIAYKKIFGEPMELHYGQRLRICNECVSEKGFYYLQSQLASGRYSSQKQAVVASLNACADNTFVVCRPRAKRGDIHEGGIVNLGDPVVLLHSITNSPLCCNGALQRTSYGMEYTISCEYVTSKHTRARGAVAVDEENFFCFSYGNDGQETINTSECSISLMASTMPITSGDGITKILNRIRQGAIYYGGRVGLRAISRSLGVACNECRKVFLGRSELHNLVARLGAELRPIELDVIMKKFDINGDDRVCAQDFLAELRGNLNSERLRAVLEAYQRLVIEGRGSVEFDFMFCLYCHNAPNHPDVQDGLITREEAIFDFENSWPAAFRHKLGTVRLDEFIEYYTDISPAILDDKRFVLTLHNCWTIPESNAYLSKKHHCVVNVTYKNGNTESIALPASCKVDTTNQRALESMLIQHGVCNIANISSSAPSA